MTPIRIFVLGVYGMLSAGPLSSKCEDICYCSSPGSRFHKTRNKEWAVLTNKIYGRGSSSASRTTCGQQYRLNHGAGKGSVSMASRFSSYINMWGVVPHSSSHLGQQYVGTKQQLEAISPTTMSSIKGSKLTIIIFHVIFYCGHSYRPQWTIVSPWPGFISILYNIYNSSFLSAFASPLCTWEPAKAETCK